MKNIKVSLIGLSGESIFLNIDELHKNGETKHAKNCFVEPGGKGYNQAVACKRLGMDVSYLTSVGNDNYGHVCEKYLNEEGIKTYFKYKENINTSLATIITNKKGDNQVTVYKGANDLLSLEDLETFKDEIKTSDIILLNNEIPYEVLIEAINFAYINNVYVVLNPAPAIYDLTNILDKVDLLIPNESEAKTIFKVNDINDIKNIKNEVIITLGDKGALYINQEEKILYPAIKTKVVDTTGAGDVFCAAIASKVKNIGITKAIKFATLASSKHIEKAHVMDAIPYLNEIE